MRLVQKNTTDGKFYVRAYALLYGNGTTVDKYCFHYYPIVTLPKSVEFVQTNKDGVWDIK